MVGARVEFSEVGVDVVGCVEVVEGVGEVVVGVGTFAGGTEVVVVVGEAVVEGAAGGGVLGVFVTAGVGTGGITVGVGEDGISTSTVPVRTGVSYMSLNVSEKMVPVAEVTASEREAGPTAATEPPCSG